MILPIKKVLAFLPAVILSLSLCNTAAVFATESISTTALSLQSDGKAAVSTLSAAEMSDNTTPLSDNILPEDDTIWKNAATINELMSLLEESDWINAGGHIRITADLVISSKDSCTIWPDTSADMPLVLDLGTHTLYVEGYLKSFGNIKYIGDGGENGLLRIRGGGEANIRSSLFVVTEEGGHAIWQEEGSLLKYSHNENTVGEIHFAEVPVAVPFSVISPDVALPVVVHDGQTIEDVLPATDSVRLYWQGVVDQGTADEDKLIPVVWDLEPYRAQLEARERVLITGSYPGVIAFQTPVCLVVFQNGNPATLLNGYSAYSYNQPIAIINVELEQPELGCRFEWSQDGETWLPTEFEKIPNGDGPLRFKVSFSQEAPPPTYPYYLSAVVDYPDSSMGYSDVIIFTESNRQCDSGGNRGGGTDITNPPNVLVPDSPDYSGIDGSSGQKPENSGSDNIENLEPDSVPAPTPEQSTRPDTTPSPVPESPDSPDTAPDAVTEPPDSPNTAPDAVTEPPDSANTAPDAVTEPPDSASTAPDAVTEPPDSPDTAPSAITEPPDLANTAPGAITEPPDQSDTASTPKVAENSEVVSQPKSTISPGGEVPVSEQAAPPARVEPEPIDSVLIPPVPLNPADETSVADTMSPQSDDTRNSPLAKAVPIIIGGTVTTAVIGAAGVYHSESLRRRLRAARKKLLRTKG